MPHFLQFDKKEFSNLLSKTFLSMLGSESSSSSDLHLLNEAMLAVCWIHLSFWATLAGY